MARGRIRNQHANAFRSPKLASGVFQVHDIAKCALCKDLPRWAVTLTNSGKHYDAIAGPAAGKLTVGDMVRVHGCVLLRRGEPVLVVCSMKPISKLEQDGSEGSQWKRERRYSTIP